LTVVDAESQFLPITVLALLNYDTIT
jgi:hypothetical protein